MSLINNMPEIEVEKKFLLNKKDESSLLEGASFVSEKTFTDIYYDTQDFSLTRNDIWLRERAGEWELKVSLNPNKDKFADRYIEVKDEKEICKQLSLPSDFSLNLVLKDAGYLVFCECITTRKKYKIGKFTIDVDRVKYTGTDFVYNIVEIECMIKNEKDINNTLIEIIDFARSRGIEPSPVLGKILVYLKKCRPEHFQALIESGTVKADQIGEVEY